MNFELKTKIDVTKVEEVGRLIRKSNIILLVGHKNPDGDTVGCMTAMVEYLKSADKNYIAFLADGVPGNLEYLKYSHEIVNSKEVLKNDFSLVITLDCADMRYSGIEEYLVDFREKGVTIVNIDHHLSDYGQINIVDDSASSTSVILHDMFKIWGVVVDKDIATSFLAGVVVDTTSFTNSATNDKSLSLSAELIERGGKYSVVNRELYGTKTKNSFRLWSRVLKRLKKNDKLKVAYSVVLAEDIEEAGAEEVGGMSNFLGNLTGAKVSMLLKEVCDGEIKVSMRAIDNKVDVAELAQLFGGGGHRKAAGFSISGRLEQEGSGWRVV